MPPLIFTQNYIDFLKNTHPNLNINQTPNGVPFFCTHINIWEILPQNLLGKIARSFTSISPQIFYPKILVLGLPFEPYCQNKIFSKHCDFNFLKLKAQKNNCEIIMISNIHTDNITNKIKFIKNYKTTPSFPNMIITTTAKSFESYLLQLSSKNRQDIRRNIRIFSQNKHKIINARKINKNFYKNILLAYNHEFKRAKIKWLAYSSDYFKYFLDHSPNAHMLYAVDHNYNFLGFIQSIATDTEFHVGRLGIAPRYHNKDAVYFRLLYASIEQAINLGKPIIHLAPTAYRLKKRLGANFQPLDNFLYPISPKYKILLLAHKYICSYMLGHLRCMPTLKGNY